VLFGHVSEEWPGSRDGIELSEYQGEGLIS
jgi:hypothetical protein